MSTYYIVRHDPAQHLLQTHSVAKVRCSLHVLLLSGVPACPKAPQRADASVCAVETAARDTAASIPCPECLRQRSPFFPRCWSPGLASTALAQTSASSARSSTPR